MCPITFGTASAKVQPMCDKSFLAQGGDHEDNGFDGGDKGSSSQLVALPNMQEIEIPVAKQRRRMQRKSMTLPLETPTSVMDHSTPPQTRTLSCNGLFTEHAAQTMFRRWESRPMLPESITEGPVPGLRDAFGMAGLTCYCSAAEAWCSENGAAFIGELIEELDSLCETLGPPGSCGLAPHLRSRLRSVLASSMPNDEHSAPNPPFITWSIFQPGTETSANLKRTSSLAHLRGGPSNPQDLAGVMPKKATTN